jgi:multidrug efflux system outer membrane protein
MIKAEKQNPSLQAAAARIEQARAISRVSRSEWVPDVRPSASYRRSQESKESQMAFIQAPVSMWRIPFDLSYELDLWGRVRRGFEAARATLKRLWLRKSRLCSHCNPILRRRIS